MKSIYLPLVVSISLCLFVSCENKLRSDEKDIALVSNKAKEKRKPVPPDGKNEIAANADDNRFDTTTSPQPQQPQKHGTKNNPQPNNTDWDKKIIKDAVINAEVKDFENFYSSLREKIKNLGGYVAQEQQSQSDYKIENSITIKVPVDKFDDAITGLTAGIDKLNDKEITSQDVTSEYVDTRSRMEAKKEVRERYIDFLKEARNINEVLSVQVEINDIQEEIESATGRINYLSHASSFSTINFTFYQVLNSSYKDTVEPSFITKLGTSFKTGWQWMGELIVGFVTLWPLILLIIAGWAIIKRFTRSKPKPASSSN